jgi:hypothetical protein
LALFCPFLTLTLTLTLGSFRVNPFKVIHRLSTGSIKSQFPIWGKYGGHHAPIFRNIMVLACTSSTMIHPCSVFWIMSAWSNAPISLSL